MGIIKMKLLLTGSNGQLGRELAIQLMDRKGIVVFPVDIDELDITDVHAVNNMVGDIEPDMVVNCAAYTNVEKCEANENNAKAVNSLGAGILAKAAFDAGASIIHFSTDYVFDGNKGKPYTEEDEPNPINIYGLTKLEGENAVKAGSPRHFILRTAWLYGDGNNFVRTMLRLSKETKTIKVVNDKRGTPTSTAELARADMRLMDTKEYGIYHATCEGSCTWYEFAQKIFEIKDKPVKVIPCSSSEVIQKARRPGCSVLDNRNFRDRLGYRFCSWQDALKEYLKGELS